MFYWLIILPKRSQSAFNQVLVKRDPAIFHLSWRLLGLAQLLLRLSVLLVVECLRLLVLPTELILGRHTLACNRRTASHKRGPYTLSQKELLRGPCGVQICAIRWPRRLGGSLRCTRRSCSSPGWWFQMITTYCSFLRGRSKWDKNASDPGWVEYGWRCYLLLGFVRMQLNVTFLKFYYSSSDINYVNSFRV